MSKVHIARQGFLTKSAIPTISRSVDGSTTDSQLLLLGSGSNGSTTFTDSSIFNNTVSRFGDAVISTAQFPSGMSSSMLFDGTGDYLSVTNSNLVPGTNNFTFETYIYITANVTSTRSVIASWGNSTTTTHWSMGVYNQNAPYVESYIGGIYTDFLGTQNSVTLNTWHHLAWVRSGNTFTLYLNGVAQASRTASGTVQRDGTPNTVTIGGVGNVNIQYWNGYISNSRITIGVPVYTSNFTPPSLPLPNNVSSPLIITNNTYGVYQNY